MKKFEVSKQETRSMKEYSNINLNTQNKKEVNRIIIVNT